MRRFVVALALMLGLSVPVAAQAPASAGPSIQVEHPWARATLAGTTTGAIYMTLHNTGGADDHLVGASTPVAARAQVHEMKLDSNGVMKMRPVASLVVKAGGDTVLAPDGYHVMLTGLRHPLKAGDSFPLTLKLAKAGTEQVTVMVEKPTAAAGGMGKMGNMSGMGGMQPGK